MSGYTYVDDELMLISGCSGLVNKIALKYYMDYFDFSGLRLDFAFRRLCAKLYLKAETQQVDRILEEFSRRYWATNPGTIYGSSSGLTIFVSI